MYGARPDSLAIGSREEACEIMADVMAVLDEAGLTNPQVRNYVSHWAEHTGAAQVEVVSAPPMTPASSRSH